jgi:ATP phosphoribosyltransferase regulatory subunit
MRDQSAAEVAARRRLEGRLLALFARWGYAEVATPTLEFYETFLRGAGPGVGDRLLKLVDSGGEVMAMRPEMTVPLARFAATRLLPAGRSPVRLAYVAPVFRGQERGSGREREFVQAGVELIGAGGPRADAEVIALAAEALQAAGVAGAVISVGHAGFLRGVMNALPEATAEGVRDLLYRRAFADLDEAALPDTTREVLRALPALRGAGALDQAAGLVANGEGRAALEALGATLEAVAVHAPEVQIEMDLSLIRDFDYYSGVVFEAHGPRAGLPLLGGGRYDGLLAGFGHPAPATGFALGVERLLEVAAEADDSVAPIVVAYDEGCDSRAVAVAARLREAGISAVVDPAGEVSATGKGLCIVLVGSKGLRVRRGGREEATTGETVVQAVRTVMAARP